MCVSNIVLTVLYYQHDAELDMLNVKVNELLGLHNLLPQVDVERHLHHERDG